ncbi:MAG TPA: hypothetical protein VGQ87_00515, partial [Patescibacteria group bacterium]|nr:hypothetical protein [Patescibacteria group bacterium]
MLYQAELCTLVTAGKTLRIPDKSGSALIYMLLLSTKIRARPSFGTPRLIFVGLTQLLYRFASKN